MSTPPDLATRARRNSDPRRASEAEAPQREKPAAGGGDAIGDGGERRRAIDPLARIRLALLGAGVVGVAAILILSLVPGGLRPSVAENDHLEHLLAYFFVMSAFGLQARTVWHTLAAAVLLGLVAGLTEIAQAYVPGRHPDLADALSGGLGVMLGLLVSATVAAMLRRRSRSRRVPPSAG